jgi:hypothetical protein
LPSNVIQYQQDFKPQAEFGKEKTNRKNGRGAPALSLSNGPDVCRRIFSRCKGFIYCRLLTSIFLVRRSEFDILCCLLLSALCIPYSLPNNQSSIIHTCPERLVVSLVEPIEGINYQSKRPPPFLFSIPARGIPGFNQI